MPGKRLCTIADQRLAEISGLVATKDGYLAVPDGMSGGRALEVFELNQRCRITQRHSFPQDPFDPEDMAISQDGTLWIADTGDNDLERDTVALWKIAPDRSQATLHRLKYPDDKQDAEALLVQPDGKPVIITKDLDGGGVARVYVASGELQPKQTVPLTRAGELKFSFTGTGGGPMGAIGQKLVTGAAISADGKRAVVRTYTDAYEWQVSGGNAVAAFKKGKPIRTPLPGEAQGEAISYSPDGKYFITASEASRAGDPARLFRYLPQKVSPTKQPAPLKGAEAGWFEGLRLQDIKMIIAAVGGLGVLLLLVGILAIRRARSRAWQDEEDVEGGHAGPDGWFGEPGGRDLDNPPWRDHRAVHQGPVPGDPREGYGGHAYGQEHWQPSGRDAARTGGRAIAAGPQAHGAVPWESQPPRPLKDAPSQRGGHDDPYAPQPPPRDYWSR